MTHRAFAALAALTPACLTACPANPGATTPMPPTTTTTPTPIPPPAPDPIDDAPEADVHGGPVAAGQLGTPGPAGPCQPWPATWLGDWGTAEGLDISCGGMAGACTVTRTAKTVLFTLKTPDLMNGTKACLKSGPSIFGGAFFIDRWPDDAVRLVGPGRLSRDENHVEGRGQGYVRLDGTTVAAATPAWAIGDFTIGAGPDVLMTGGNGIWAVVGASRHMSAQGGLGPPPSKRITCVGLVEPWSVGGLTGEVCRTADGALTLQATTPTVSTSPLTRVGP